MECGGIEKEGPVSCRRHASLPWRRVVQSPEGLPLPPAGEFKAVMHSMGVAVRSPEGLPLPPAGPGEAG